ncbi:thioesterase II family protein [Actinomadura syzygii]|uniref:Thioesterase domain-containing protein n=1 Tax=Actinomadura syzygii TaxID=1427538 RepID=A0A5D0UEP8_9ACTN|nr:thioesterase domain-containing protein [Actinomadura syzygii]TYC16085.1 hypothetical protein FXF65_12260 [Actinomadura syzygii]
MPGPAPARLWIRQFRPLAGCKVLMVCLPRADGRPDSFAAFADALAPSVGVLAVQYRGPRGVPRRSPPESVGEQADCVLEGVSEYIDRPVALFGDGAGAVLAFEMALRLEEEYGVDPVALFAVASRVPARRSRVRSAIVALGGDTDRGVPVSDVLDWGAHTDGEFQTKILTGGPPFLDGHFAEVVNTVTDFLLPFFDPDVSGADVIDIRRYTDPDGRMRARTDEAGE